MKHEVECPGCGKRAIVEPSGETRRMEFDCPQCATSFTVTFKTDEEDNLASFASAQDVEG